MSFAATKWGWEQPVQDAYERVVLMYLCDIADEKRGYEAWPSLSTIADRCAVNEKSVRRVLPRLEAAGLVEIDKTRRPARYRLTVRNVDSGSGYVVPQSTSDVDSQSGYVPTSGPDVDSQSQQADSQSNEPVRTKEPIPPTPHGLEREPNPEKQGGSNPQGEGRGDTMPSAWLTRPDGVSGTTVADVIRAHGKWSLEEMELRGQTPKNADRYRASVEASFAQEHAASVATRLTRYLPDVPATLVLAAEMGRPCPALAAYLPTRPTLPESPKLPPEAAAERFAALRNQIGLRLVTESESA